LIRERDGHISGEPSIEEMTMLRTLTLCFLLTGACAATVAAHHGWGKYDASKPSQCGADHRSVRKCMLISVKGPDKVWNVAQRRPRAW
jgi:hypothetical protein